MSSPNRCRTVSFPARQYTQINLINSTYSGICLRACIRPSPCTSQIFFWGEGEPARPRWPVAGRQLRGTSRQFQKPFQLGKSTAYSLYGSRELAWVDILQAQYCAILVCLCACVGQHAPKQRAGIVSPNGDRPPLGLTFYGKIFGGCADAPFGPLYKRLLQADEKDTSTLNSIFMQ